MSRCCNTNTSDLSGSVCILFSLAKTAVTQRMDLDLMYTSFSWVNTERKCGRSTSNAQKNKSAIFAGKTYQWEKMFKQAQFSNVNKVCVLCTVTKLSVYVQSWAVNQLDKRKKKWDKISWPAAVTYSLSTNLHPAWHFSFRCLKPPGVCKITSI